MIYAFLRKYHLSIDDYYDLAAIGICKAAIKFDNKKSEFSTYAFLKMKNIVFQEMKKKLTEKGIPDYQIVYYQTEFDNSNGCDTSTFINYIPSEENVEENTLSEIIFEEYINKLNDRDRQIFILISEGYKQNEIGKIVGISQGQVSRVKKKLCEYLLK